MREPLVLLTAALAVVSARPGPEKLDTQPGNPQYQYHYDVNVPETGDQKSHTEERDQAGVVVGNFQVVDPTGDLRKLFYRVEGDSGFVITDQRVMVGFAEPPPDPSTYSDRGTVDGTQEEDIGGETASVIEDGGVSDDQALTRNADQFGTGFDSFQTGFEDEGVGILSGFSGFTPGDGEITFLDEGGFSSEDRGSSSGGDSSEGGSSEGSSSSSGNESGASESEVSGTDEQISPVESTQPISSQVQDKPKVKPFKFQGPAFTFTIERTEPNRFDVKERIIGHAVEFSTHGGRARRAVLHLP